MKRYVRLLNGKIYDTTDKEKDNDICYARAYDYLIHGDFFIMIYRTYSNEIYNYEATILGFVCMQGDTIKELITDDDFVKDGILYVKNHNDNYIKIAKLDELGEYHLL